MGFPSKWKNLAFTINMKRNAREKAVGQSEAIQISHHAQVSNPKALHCGKPLPMHDSCYCCYCCWGNCSLRCSHWVKIVHNPTIQFRTENSIKFNDIIQQIEKHKNCGTYCHMRYDLDFGAQMVFRLILLGHLRLWSLLLNNHSSQLFIDLCLGFEKQQTINQIRIFFSKL